MYSNYIFYIQKKIKKKKVSFYYYLAMCLFFIQTLFFPNSFKNQFNFTKGTMDGSVSHSVLEIIQCSFSRCKGKHFLKNPVTLPCSHNVCLNCLQDVLSNVTIKEIACTYPDCTKRHEVNNLKDYKINNMVDVIIKENLNDLFSILKNSFTQIYNDFNGKIVILLIKMIKQLSFFSI